MASERKVKIDWNTKMTRELIAAVIWLINQKMNVGQISRRLGCTQLMVARIERLDEDSRQSSRIREELRADRCAERI